MPDKDNERLLRLALLRLNYYNLPLLNSLFATFHTAENIVQNIEGIPQRLPSFPHNVLRQLRSWRQMLPRVEEEMEHCSKHGIKVLCPGDEGFPKRLLECSDAPPVLFFSGGANLNARRVVSIVGTRHATQHGEDFINDFIAELRQLVPDLLIVSGLAYGVDIMAHRQSLRQEVPTVGVLAHGLDRIYPPRHRETAVEMLHKGGLLTEFFTATAPDKVNFIRRNRIIAGLSDATLLVESAEHGGGLITARLAKGYHRDVFAVPGRPKDEYSEGCNRLIASKEASLCLSATDFAKQMLWSDDQKILKLKRQGIEQTLFEELSPEETLIIDTLKKENDLTADTLSLRLNMPVQRLAGLLFSLEIEKHLLRSLVGGKYHLIV